MRTARRAFTLIELIVVIAIIAILAALSLMVGSRVMMGGRVSMTQTLLRVLDQTQDSYMADHDGKIPYKWTDESQNRNEYAIIDGRISPAGTNDIVEPSTTIYLLATSDSASVQAITKNMDAKYVVRAPITYPAPASDPGTFTNIYTKQSVQPSTSGGGQVFGLVIKDPFGRPIRYVHPKFHGGYGTFFLNGSAQNPSGRDPVFNNAGTFKMKQNGGDVAIQFRRSFRPDNNGQTGDGDEGLCTGGRGYFYSAGPDNDAGTRSDNVYLDAKPPFPPENAKFE